MKLNLLLNKLVFFLIAFIMFFSLLATIINSANASDLKKIASKLRCMTCQNQTIYDSEAEFSINIKKIVNQMLQNEQTEKEIIDFLIQRYGEYIVFEPQMNKKNIFLWCFPFVIMAFSILFLIFKIKKN